MQVQQVVLSLGKPVVCRHAGRMSGRKSVLLFFVGTFIVAVVLVLYLSQPAPSETKRVASVPEPVSTTIDTKAQQMPAAAKPTAETEGQGTSGPVVDGQVMLSEWLSQPESTDAAGLRIMRNFFLLPEKDHAAAMKHLVNMVRDPSISGLERILLDPRTSLQAKEMLFEDIKIRPDAVKFPIFLKLMQQPDHPSAQDAREILTNVLGKDFGKDYAKWEKEIERFLKE
jgi:hypothetical protein